MSDCSLPGPPNRGLQARVLSGVAVSFSKQLSVHSKFNFFALLNFMELFPQIFLTHSRLNPQMQNLWIQRVNCTCHQALELESACVFYLKCCSNHQSFTSPSTKFFSFLSKLYCGAHKIRTFCFLPQGFISFGILGWTNI